MLPYSDQQIGGTLGGPIVMDKMHYFASYEYERQPSTIFSAPAGVARADVHLPVKDHAEERAGAGRHGAVGQGLALDPRARAGTGTIPSTSAAAAYPSTAIVLGPVRHQRPRHVVAASSATTRSSRSGSATTTSSSRRRRWLIGGRHARIRFSRPDDRRAVQPAERREAAIIEGRYDLNWHKGKHDLKFGGEFLHVDHTGYWHILKNGRFTMTSVPSNLSSI